MSDLVYGSVWRDPNDGEVVMMVANENEWQKALVLVESDRDTADSTKGDVTGRVIVNWERVE